MPRPELGFSPLPTAASAEVEMGGEGLGMDMISIWMIWGIVIRLRERERMREGEMTATWMGNILMPRLMRSGRRTKGRGDGGDDNDDHEGGPGGVDVCASDDYADEVRRHSSDRLSLDSAASAATGESGSSSASTRSSHTQVRTRV